MRRAALHGHLVLSLLRKTSYCWLVYPAFVWSTAHFHLLIDYTHFSFPRAHTWCICPFMALRCSFVCLQMVRLFLLRIGPKSAHHSPPDIERNGFYDFPQDFLPALSHWVPCPGTSRLPLFSAKGWNCRFAPGPFPRPVAAVTIYCSTVTIGLVPCYCIAATELIANCSGTSVHSS